MAKHKFNQLDALMSYMRDDLDHVLRTDIADQTAKILLEHIEKDVYGAYTPKQYERRDMLRDIDYIRAEVRDGTLYVTSIAPGSRPLYNGYRPEGTGLIGIVETGSQGHGKGMWKNAFARPAVSKAQDEVNDKKIVLDVLRRRYK